MHPVLSRTYPQVDLNIHVTSNIGGSTKLLPKTAYILAGIQTKTS